MNNNGEVHSVPAPTLHYHCEISAKILQIHKRTINMFRKFETREKFTLKVIPDNLELCTFHSKREKKVSTNLKKVLCKILSQYYISKEIQTLRKLATSSHF
ncbi:Hypothetical predicted protein [Podarcis lilfordi]|uniref:Uncharacterized protein n=1 Tax=Podarcis lilfordi TaxID=74358 RepID=A0AA35K2R4_9SAUR|nr:Hypothetical predicted protein [Podarcis lilfordi]